MRVNAAGITELTLMPEYRPSAASARVEPEDAGLARHVGAGERRAEHRRRRHVDDAARARCLEVRPRGAAHAHRAAVVRVDEQVEVLGRHLVERSAAGDAGVVHDDVDAPELVERVLDDHRGAVADDAVAVGDRDAAVGADLLGRVIGRGLVGGDAVGGDPGVVHQHLAPARGQQAGVRPPEAPARRR